MPLLVLVAFDIFSPLHLTPHVTFRLHNTRGAPRSALHSGMHTPHRCFVSHAAVVLSGKENNHTICSHTLLSLIPLGYASCPRLQLLFHCPVSLPSRVSVYPPTLVIRPSPLPSPPPSSSQSHILHRAIHSILAFLRRVSHHSIRRKQTRAHVPTHLPNKMPRKS